MAAEVPLAPALPPGYGVGEMNVDATIETGDLEIGAVELKNATDDTRSPVDAEGVRMVGAAAHDAAAAGKPVLMGGSASAAAPSSVSADGDATTLWVLRNGAIAAVLTAAGALIGGDATNGLDVDVTRIAAGENHLGEVGGRTVRVDDTAFTRPNDTTAYAARDVIADSTSAATIRTFGTAGRISGGSGYITKALLQTSDSAQVNRVRLHLYSTSSPTVINDNAANTVLYADRAKYVGYIDFPALSTETSGSEAFALWTGALPYLCVGNDDLFGVLETLDAFTPTAQSTWFVSIWCDQN